jgi:uncharacterized DUF497 family protein
MSAAEPANTVCPINGTWIVRELHFEWDEAKNVENARKHGIWFAEAKSVFLDDRALFRWDEPDPDGEERFALVGLSAMLRTLVVCHCYRAEGAAIRILSARKATRSERADYESRWAR